MAGLESQEQQHELLDWAEDNGQNGKPVTRKQLRDKVREVRKANHPQAADLLAWAAFREAMKHQGERTDLVDNVNEVMDRPDGNSRAYSIARVQRECDPETVAGAISTGVDPGTLSPGA